ncbi:hypothetical protein D5086_018811 [Populus alba]|uniref:Uncharacterized protein n=1 Tax=Populus alba TaxID=43335 RepID=A0ACC4BRE5_POPAL
MERQRVMERGEKAGVSSSSYGGGEVDVVVEMMDVIEAVGLYVVRVLKTSLDNFKKALLAAKKLLKKCKLWKQDLSGISVEVKEQVELTRMQLKRAKKRSDTQDIELAMDMMVVFSKKDDRNADNAILERLAIKLELHAVPDLKAEEVAVRKLVNERGVQNAESIQQIKDLLGKFKQIAGVDEAVVLDGPFSSKSLQRCRSLLIPHEFLCPITLEIMVDPVIVATGQTYERESIQKWLNSNHRTCPKTGQTLGHLSLASNFALRNLIQEWCEKNNYELHKKDACLGSDGISAELKEEISSLVQNLSSSEFESATRGHQEDPSLSYQDPNIQEHTHGTNEARENSAAALFSLSMLDENKVLIGASNGIRPLVHLLQNGTIRGRNEIGKLSFIKTLIDIHKKRDSQEQGMRPIGPSPAGVAQFIHHPSSTSRTATCKLEGGYSSKEATWLMVLHQEEALKAVADNVTPQVPWL